jgi:hypothetical protein
MNARTLIPLFLAVIAAGCGDAANIDVVMGPKGKLPTDVPPIEQPPVLPPEDPTNPATCNSGFTYQGFGGLRLEVGRDEETVGSDRDRVKPLSALTGEYARVLGTTPALLSSLSNTFGNTPPRWYIEPQANAVSLFSSMRVAFVGCLNMTATTDYDVMPNATNARTRCADFAHRFWSRAADDDELDSCVTMVTTKTAGETNARRKWAYACASVLSSASFLTY